jgi:putative transposase
LNACCRLTVGDGALGFWKAIEEVFPGTRHQRCWVHKTANVLNKVALSVQVNMKADLREIYGAPTRVAAWSSNSSTPLRKHGDD